MIANEYGVLESNPINKDMQEVFLGNDCETVYWTEPGLKIVRLRLLTDPGYPAWDVSYCWGYVKDRPVHVQLPFSQLRKRGMKSAIIYYAKEDKVFAKGLNIFEPGVISQLM